MDNISSKTNYTTMLEFIIRKMENLTEDQFSVDAGFSTSADLAKTTIETEHSANAKNTNIIPVQTPVSYINKYERRRLEIEQLNNKQCARVNKSTNKKVEQVAEQINNSILLASKIDQKELPIKQINKYERRRLEIEQLNNKQMLFAASAAASLGKLPFSH